MDLKVSFEDRDLAQTPQGWVVPITGVEELAQRIHLRLGIRRGSFRLDPELGSRLYSLSRSTPQRMAEEAREIIEEALAPMAGMRLLEVRCRYDPAADKAELDCRFSWSGQELETTLEV